VSVLKTTSRSEGLLDVPTYARDSLCDRVFESQRDGTKDGLRVFFFLPGGRYVPFNLCCCLACSSNDTMFTYVLFRLLALLVGGDGLHTCARRDPDLGRREGRPLELPRCSVPDMIISVLVCRSL
jgi:hypothetical protein